MDLATLRRLYQACDPLESLGPDDPRNVDIDREPGEVRGRRWVEYLGRHILLSRPDRPPCLLFTSVPGSGKSTELRRLARFLGRDGEAGAQYLVVLLDAAEVFDLTSTIDVPDILYAVLDRAERAVVEAEGGNPAGALERGLVERLWDWLVSVELELREARVEVPGAGGLVAELRTRPDLRRQVREALARHLGSFLEEVHRALRELDERAREAGWADGLVIIVDSLEKLRGTSTNFAQVLASAEQVFAGGARYLRLPVPVLYTVPPALTTRIRGIEFMPVVKVREPGGTRLAPEGRAVLREVVRRRIHDDELRHLLGRDFERRLDEVFLLSGGHPREVVQVLRSLLVHPDLPVPDRAFERVLADLEAQYHQVVPASAFAWLARLESEHPSAIPIEGDEHRRAADQVLSNNGILYYWNGRPWWGLHPAVRAIPGIARRLRRLVEVEE